MAGDVGTDWATPTDNTSGDVTNNYYNTQQPGSGTSDLVQGVTAGSTALTSLTGLMSTINTANQNQFTNNLNQQIQSFNEETAQAQIALSNKEFGINKETALQQLATAGQTASEQSQVFNEQQKSYAMNQKFGNALAAGIATGLAASKNPAQSLIGQSPAAPQQPVQQPSPYIGTNVQAPSTATQLSSPTLSGAPKA